MDILQACKEGNVEYVKAYIEAGNDLDIQESDTLWTPLINASGDIHPL